MNLTLQFNFNFIFNEHMLDLAYFNNNSAGIRKYREFSILNVKPTKLLDFLATSKQLITNFVLICILFVFVPTQLMSK